MEWLEGLNELLNEKGKGKTGEDRTEFLRSTAKRICDEDCTQYLFEQNCQPDFDQEGCQVMPLQKPIKLGMQQLRTIGGLLLKRYKAALGNILLLKFFVILMAFLAVGCYLVGASTFWAAFRMDARPYHWNSIVVVSLSLVFFGNIFMTRWAANHYLLYLKKACQNLMFNIRNDLSKHR